MSLLPIRVFGDPVLRERARPVERFDGALRRLASDMIQTMKEAPGVGLAAPQVGRALRLIVFDLGEEDGSQALANPVLRDEWGEQVGEEGCLSVPGLYYPVRRYLRVQAEGYDLDGHEVNMEASELHSRILQHEVDHLNGVLFIDRLEAEHRSEAMAALRDQALGLQPAVAHPNRTL
jgi:peptide deformylase